MIEPVSLPVRRPIGGLLASALLALTTACSGQALLGALPDWPVAGWEARAHGPGVLYANNFSDPERDFYPHLWPDPARERRASAFDEQVQASGRGSLRFDILPLSGEGFGGELAISLGDDPARQFGAGDELWVQWRQRFDAYLLTHRYRVSQGQGQWKQLIISQGQLPGQSRWDTRSCSENQVVVTNAGGRGYPQAYHGCWVYLNIQSNNGRAISRMNFGQEQALSWPCQYHPPRGEDSACFRYRPDQWMTFMVHLKIGQPGRAVSSLSGKLENGFVDSVYELYGAYEGGVLRLLHRQSGIVLRRGNYRDDPHDASHRARYGMFRFLPHISYKDGSEDHPVASTWYDEIIISRQAIPAPP
ncbi:MAG: hypothetical protein D6727_05455 [Gammaproteobacteria bacterium]|nr:MAG: hypothetical protein D6727_05455 [Gammaproteobacteria bacterium]